MKYTIALAYLLLSGSVAFAGEALEKNTPSVSNHYQQAKQIIQLMSEPGVSPESSHYQELNNQLEAQLKQIQYLEDQSDINLSQIEELSNRVSFLDKQLNFRFFGSLAFRNCYMTTNVITEPGNLLKNTRGNMFQTRFGAGIAGNFVEDFNYQLRFFSIDPNSFNLPWLPVSTNIIRLPISLDRFSINYVPSVLNNPNQIVKFTFGKSLNFLPETELLFDEDVSFTGMNQQINWFNLSPIVKEVGVTLAENVLLNEATFATTYMLAGKAFTELEPVEKLRIKAGGSYMFYPGSENLGKYNFIQGYLGEFSKFNRKNNASQEFTSKFNQVNGFLKLSYPVMEKLPLELVFDWVYNLGSSDRSQGFLAGFNLGSLQKPGDWMLSYNYKVMEQDYQFSFFVQDQMGGTDVSGHQIDLSAKLAEKTSLIFNFQNRRNLSDQNLPQLYILYTTLRQDF